MPATEATSKALHGSFHISVAGVDPANHTAVASVDTVLTHPEVRAGDEVIAIPPADLEAGIAVVGCHTVIGGGFTLRTTNPSAGAINPAAKTWEFIVHRPLS